MIGKTNAVAGSGVKVIEINNGIHLTLSDGERLYNSQSYHLTYKVVNDGTCILSNIGHVISSTPISVITYSYSSSARYGYDISTEDYITALNEMGLNKLDDGQYTIKTVLGIENVKTSIQDETTLIISISDGIISLTNGSTTVSVYSSVDSTNYHNMYLVSLIRTD